MTNDQDVHFHEGNSITEPRYEPIRGLTSHGQKYPEMYVGSLKQGDVWAICEPLIVASLSPAFVPPELAEIWIGKHQAVLQIWSAGLTARFTSYVTKGMDASDLRDVIESVAEQTTAYLNTEAAVSRYHGHISFANLMCGTVLAERAVIGMRLQDRFVRQDYSVNQPTSSIRTINSSDKLRLRALGLYIGLDFSVGLLSSNTYSPYRLERWLASRQLLPFPCPLRIVSYPLKDVTGFLDVDGLARSVDVCVGT